MKTSKFNLGYIIMVTQNNSRLKLTAIGILGYI